MIRCEVLVGTVSASAANAAGTFTTLRPILGEIIEIRNPGAALGATADYTLTRGNDGGTILSALDYAAPWTNRPSPTLNNGTAAAGTATSGVGIPCAGHLTMTVGSAVASTAGTFFIYYRADE